MKYLGSQEFVEFECSHCLKNEAEREKIENDLIANDKLYSSVKLQKEIGGIKIESTGFGESISVTITVYRSYDNLKKDGYIKKIEQPEIE